MNVRASAPGKVFILGEYAALKGAPALLMAIDRRVQVHARSIPGNRWTIRERPGGLEHSISLPELLATPAPGNLVAAVVQTVRNAGRPLPEGLSLESDRTGLVRPSGAPLGLGSSAAAAAALTAALAVGISPEGVTPLAVEAHRHFQGGLGSGYDVVCSCTGGLLEVRAPDNTFGDSDYHKKCTTVPITTRVALPDDLTLAMALGRTATSTTEVLRRFDRAVGEVPRLDEAVRELVELSDRACGALHDGNGRLLVESMRRFCEVEADLGEAMGVELVPRAVLGLSSGLERLGGALKPSGAGGGDLVVVLVPRSQREAASRLVRGSGFEVLDTGCEDQGLRVSARD